MNDLVASSVLWTMDTSCWRLSWARAGSPFMRRSTIWAWRTILVRLWAGPSCIARAMSRRMSSWAPRTILENAGETATRSPEPRPLATPGPALMAARPAASSATISLYRPRTLALPSRTSTWASMSTARRVSVTSCSARSSCSAGSPAPAARAATRRSATWARFASWRLASVRACWTSSSISASSFCIVSA